MEHFKKLMEKKRKEGHGHMEPMEAAARGSVLGHLMSSLDEDGAKKVKGIKKVTVASNSTKGVEHGLDTAKHILHEGEKEVHGGDEDENNLLDHSLKESPEYDDEEGEEAQDDAPEDHIHEAEHNDKMSMHTMNPQKMGKYAKGGSIEDADHESKMASGHHDPMNDHNENPEAEEYTDKDEHEQRADHLAKENAHLKMLIEQLRAPKSFY